MSEQANCPIVPISLEGAPASHWKYTPLALYLLKQAVQANAHVLMKQSEGHPAVYSLNISGIMPLWRYGDYTYITPGLALLSGPHCPTTIEQKKHLVETHARQPFLASQLDNPRYDYIIIFSISIDDETHYGAWGRQTEREAQSLETPEQSEEGKSEQSA